MPRTQRSNPVSDTNPAYKLLHETRTHRVLRWWASRMAGNWFVWCVLWASFGGLTAAHSQDAPVATMVADREALVRHVGFLASDSLRGRQAGSDGARAAAVYITSELDQYGVRPGGEDGSYYQEFGRGYRNLLARIEPEVPSKSDQSADAAAGLILVGAHYDHVGLGNRRNSHGPWGLIHNGADDNASGTSVLLEVARLLSARRERFQRTVLIAFWDAEEAGLLGSQHWVRSQAHQLAQVDLVVNLDMVGRLRKQKLTVYGARTAPGLRSLVSRANRDSALAFKFDSELRSDSDHFSFLQRNKPFLMLFTGMHADYHRPSDDVDKLNVDGMQQVAGIIARVVSQAAEASTEYRFRPLARSESRWGTRQPVARPPSTSRRLGVRWRWEQDAVEGADAYHVVHIEPRSAAARSGLRADDRVLRFAGQVVTDRYDLRSLVYAAPRRSELTVWRPRLLEASAGGNGNSGERVRLVLELPGDPIRVGLEWQRDAAEPNSVTVSHVYPDSAADVAGLKVGDRIWAINGALVAPEVRVRDLLLSGADELNLEIERSGQVRELKLKPILTLQAAPAEPLERSEAGGAGGELNATGESR